jgi:hypothetical protein
MYAIIDYVYDVDAIVDISTSALDFQSAMLQLLDTSMQNLRPFL